MMKIALAGLAFAGLLCGTPGWAQQPRRAGPGDVRQFEAWLDGFLAEQLESSAAASLGFVLVWDGRITFAKGYGMEAGRVPVNPERTLFRAASVSKLFTATAVMQLVEQGKLSLAEDIRTYLPGLPIRPYGDARVTLAHLLTHTSGIEEPLFGNTVASAAQMPSLAEYFARNPPRFGRPPGREIIYSNQGLTLAGHIVERASGMAFEEYVERAVLRPLGMTRSSFRQPYPPALAPHVVPSGGDQGAMIQRPAGTLIGTVHDMGRFIAAQLGGGRIDGRQALAEGAIREMHRRRFTHHPGMPGVALGFFESFINGRRALFHTGASGHQSVLYLLPEQNTGFYLVHSGGGQELRRRFVQAFMDRYYPAPADARMADARVVRPADFAGWYRPNLLPRTRIEKVGELALDTRVRADADGALAVLMPPLGSRRMRLTPAGPSLFRTDDGYFVGFAADGDGRARRMFVSGPLFDPTSFDRLRWYERGTVHALLGGLGCLVFLSVPLVAVACALRRRREDVAPGSMRRWAWRAALAVSLLVLISPVLLLLSYFMGDPEMRPYKVALSLSLATGTLLVGAVLGLALPVFAVMMWRRGDGSRPWRVYYGVVALAALLMVPFLVHWNLLGFRF